MSTDTPPTPPTESEFRRKLCNEAGLHPISASADAVVKIFRESFGGFAPEPLVLPERLVISVADHTHLMPAMDCLPGWPTEAHRRASYQQAAERHNAYPGLFRAAERLVVLISPRVEIRSADLASSPPDGLRDRLSDLRDELAKGPKP